MRVQVEPLGVELELAHDEPLMQAARRLGYYWPTVCGGNAECGACRCEILAGTENLVPPGEAETRLLSRFPNVTSGTVTRLACQLIVTGPVAVTRKGVRKR